MEQALKILITGGGGFIGSHMVDYLKKRGHFVIAVDLEFPEIRQRWWGQADQCLKLDVRGNLDVFESIDYVYHFASDMGGVGYFTTHDYYPYLNNMTIDINVLRACEKYQVKRLFYSSSACIYPIHKQENTSLPVKLKEDMIFPANSDLMYGWEKLMMTMLCQRSPLDARVGIFHTIYGEGQEFEGERSKFPPTIVKKVLDARTTGKVKLWGDGKQKRTYLFIDDAVEKIYLVMHGDNYEGEVNIAGDECVSVLETAKLVSKIVGISPEYIFEPDKPSGVLARDADNTKFIKTYGYKNRFSLESGMTRMVDWLTPLI